MVWPTDYDTKLGEYDAIDLPGQQLPAAQALSPLDHILNLDIKAAPGCQRLTNIMASIGRASNDVETMERMIGAGMNIALLNMAFGTREYYAEVINMLREAAKNYGTAKSRTYPLSIAMKLAGKKIKTGKIADTYGNFVEIETGETVRLTTDETYKERCSSTTVYVDFMFLADQVSKGNHILLDNELIDLKVEVISATTLTCKVERGGILGSNKDVFVPNVHLNMPSYSEKDKLDIEMGVRNQVDIYLAPFVENAHAISELRDLIGDKSKKAAIIATIQTIEGFKNYDAILQVCDGIMLTRQELGSDITPKKLVIAQKNLIARANVYNKPVCVSAHILTSMEHRLVPHRSELLDIANCVLDGVDSLMLSAETAIGEFPVDAVSVLSAACKEAEACIWTRQTYNDLVDKTPIPCDQATGAAIAAVLASQRAIASAIIVITTTGKTAQLVSKYRPRCPIIAITRYPCQARLMHVYRGVMPIIYEDTPDSDWPSDVDKRVNFGIKWAMSNGFVRVGDPLVVVSGWKQGSGFTNTMRIIYAPADTTVM